MRSYGVKGVRTSTYRVSFPKRKWSLPSFCEKMTLWLLIKKHLESVEFCENSEYVHILHIRRPRKTIQRFTWDWADFAYADLKSSFQFWGCLRPIWPLKSYICTFSCKCHISLAFCYLRLFNGLFAIDLILLQKLQKIQSDLWPHYSFEASEIILGANW